MVPSHLDPTQYVALHSLSFGDFLSPDGRAHPIDASTPVSLTEVAPTVVPNGTQTGPQVSARDTTSPCDAFVLGSPEWIACKLQIGSHAGPPDPSPCDLLVVGSPEWVACKLTGGVGTIVGGTRNLPLRIGLGLLAIGILLIVAFRFTT